MHAVSTKIYSIKRWSWDDHKLVQFFVWNFPTISLKKKRKRKLCPAVSSLMPYLHSGADFCCCRQPLRMALFMAEGNFRNQLAAAAKLGKMGNPLMVVPVAPVTGGSAAGAVPAGTPCDVQLTCFWFWTWTACNCCVGGWNGGVWNCWVGDWTWNCW